MKKLISETACTTMVSNEFAPAMVDKSIEVMSTRIGYKAEEDYPGAKTAFVAPVVNITAVPGSALYSDVTVTVTMAVEF